MLDTLLKQAKRYARDNYTSRIRTYEQFKRAIAEMHLSPDEYLQAVCKLAHALKV